MEYGLSTYLYVNKRLNSHILDKILRAGIRNVELLPPANTWIIRITIKCATWPSGFTIMR